MNSTNETENDQARYNEVKTIESGEKNEQQQDNHLYRRGVAKTNNREQVRAVKRELLDCARV
jgi:hypothetical protein